MEMDYIVKCDRDGMHPTDHTMEVVDIIPCKSIGKMQGDVAVYYRNILGYDVAVYCYISRQHI